MSSKEGAYRRKVAVVLRSCRYVRKKGALFEELSGGPENYREYMDC